MACLTRRSLLRCSIGLAAAGALARPHIANAEAKTATVWWVQGFVPEEDAAFHQLAADYQKESGNKLDYSIVPFAPMRQKIVSALTSGVVPDLMQATPAEIVPLSAWKGQLVDVTDVVQTQKSEFLPVGLQSAYCYSNVEKRRSYYAVPFAGAIVPFPCLGLAGREGRVQDRRRPEDLGRLHRFLQADAGEAARPGDAPRLQLRLGDQQHRGRPDQHLQRLS